ncbi:MAG: ergothioneine biosynthesis protein EgtB [Aquabacterium sp.]|uniref:ergothioneine biosynthesis protein EgtB n=1 Tax=Aquabacterium sp. TaxID=1872578 RepID=UPI0025BED6A5|nr:ergothioneine biosynthesis protein EgtB [Aquabacterium sp.]MBI3381039.1 ergothioneine biosynthesis protein EgtB [Aquabacterium sp.]
MPLPSAEPGPSLASRYHDIRATSEALCAPLAAEDHVPQPVAHVSPPKWHLAHTTWFFEAFVLSRLAPEQAPWHPLYGYLFNSYYETVGQRVLRHQRGTLSRPTVDEILAYRHHIDECMMGWLARELDEPVCTLIELGLQHEQQHQELLLTDIKAILGGNPLQPPYAHGTVASWDLAREHGGTPAFTTPSTPGGWLDIDGGLYEVGHKGQGFAFDNEGSRHVQHLRPFQIQQGLVSNRDYLAFMADQGYQRHELWHAEGWDWLQTEGIAAPLYWSRDDKAPSGWAHYTLRGAQPVSPDAPVSHLSYYEAHAFAQWAGCRLPTEFEWEAAQSQLTWGQRWEWTASAYQPYPGFQKAPGAVGEYNGKFMVNQMVLRGSSFATPPGHARATYRNFFHPPLRWQYTGVRLARD